MTRVNNMKELQRAMQPVLKNMVNEMAERVYQTLNYFLKLYYDKYDPLRYERTKQLLFSAVKVEAQPYHSGYRAVVYINTDSLDYNKMSGYQVADWANQGLHGGLNTGDDTPRIWDDTIKENIEDGQLLLLAKDYLRKAGFTVK